MNQPKNQGLPRDVQENIIHNIQQVFPDSISRGLIRNVLNKENWDLEKSLRFLHGFLQSNHNSKDYGNLKQKNKINNAAKPSIVNKNNSGPTKTQKQNNKPNLFKHGPNSEKVGKKKKPKPDNVKNEEWVMINSPSTNQNAPSTSKKGNKKPKAKTSKLTKDDLIKKVEGESLVDLSTSSVCRQARRTQLVQNYEIIKLFRDTADRVSAYIKENIKIMVLLRGCSGSGKTSYANSLLQNVSAKNPQNHIFSTDNFFIRPDGKYYFNVNLLSEAHEWNKKLVKLAASEGRSPIFIDNTNSCLWEMHEYAVIAVKYGYVLETLEPPIPWFFNEDILFRKSSHSVPRETIRRMLDRYEANISGEDILKKLHLSYIPPMVPPLGAMAGLDTPISKKHARMLGVPFESNSVPSNGLPNSPRPTIIMKSKQLSNDPFGSCLSQSQNKFAYQETEQNRMNPLPPSFDLINFSLDDNEVTLLPELSSKESSSEESESEEMSSTSSSADGDSQNESDSGELSSIYETDYNHEYVLISENNLVIFQKEHEEMKDITTIKQFQEMSDNKPCRFEDRLLNYMESSGHDNDSKFLIGPSGDNQILKPTNTFSTSSFEPANNSYVNSVTDASLIPQIISRSDYQDFNFDLPTKINANNVQNVVSPQGITVTGSSFNFANTAPCTSEVTSLSVNETETPASNQELEGAAGGSMVIDTLHSLFPKVPKENLLELFGSSLQDIDWAIELLLDSGEEMVQSSSPLDMYKSTQGNISEEKQNIAYGIEGDGKVPSSQVNLRTDNKVPGTSNNLFEKLSSIGSNKDSYSSFSGRGSEEKHFSETCITDAVSFRANSPKEIPHYIGDWDFKRELPKELPVDLPKIQRTPKPSFRNASIVDVATETNYMDFEIIRNLNGGCISKGLKIKVIIGNNSFVSGQSRPIPVRSVLMLEKGTMTSAIETKPVNMISGIERLALMFPRVTRENLEELFEKCQKDIDWAAGLLLDSGQEMSELFTSLEPIDFCEEENVLERESKESATDPNDSCQNNNDPKPSKRRKRTRHPKVDNDEVKEIQETLQNNIVLDESCYSSEKMKKYFKRKYKNENAVENSESQLVQSEEITYETSEDFCDADNDIVFSFDKELVLQLQSRFGGLLRSNMIGETTFVNLPLNLARQLHSYVMDSIHEHIKEEDVFTDEDEEYARHLQEEEMRAHHGTPSLLDIMDEEVAYRKTQKDLGSGRLMSSTLSKQLLIERFPKMDPSTLAMIFEDTNHSLHQATMLLSSAGYQAEVEPSPATSPVKTKGKEKPLSREEAIKQADAYGDISSQLYEMRKDCLHKSQKAHREGNPSVAVYYSDMARWYMERIEKCNSEAAKAILNGYEGWTTLDLHFLQVSEALNVFDLFVDEVIRDLKKDSDKKQTEVFVITGRGLHSVGGRPKLKPAVINRLTQRELRFSELNPGMLKVFVPRNAQTSYKRETSV